MTKLAALDQLATEINAAAPGVSAQVKAKMGAVSVFGVTTETYPAVAAAARASQIFRSVCPRPGATGIVIVRTTLR